MNGIADARMVEVSAAVLLRESGGSPEFLLARRPEGKVYAGYWEFPGGKVEPGETFREALGRELREELGIDVRRAWPWVVREFTYPHATVRLKFFRVTAWRGEIRPIEHSGLAWLKAGGPAGVSPILPANGPILRALELPPVYALTHAEEAGIDAELRRLETALDTGLRLVQARDKTLSPEDRVRLAEGAMARLRPYPDARLLINDDEALARSVGAHGVHLSSLRLAQIGRRPGFAWVAASCHTSADLARAAELGLDFAVLGPVLPTLTHPGSAGIGWEAFARLIEISPLPVYALGGLRQEMLETAREHGAQGIALMRGWG
ncbi:MAG: Nudix family hydrolase [Betaproteobacteria bacterium]|nr:Nudix family hydrolase [Betaproteobacteria bacterium]